MAWTTPRTWVAGEMGTAALLNQQLRDNLLASETAVVTTVEDLIVGTGLHAVARQAATPTGGWMQIVGGVITTAPSILIPGSIAWFNGAACPVGWTEVVELRGRTPVGLPAGGTVGGQTGTALADLGTRTMTAVPSHTHNAGAMTSSSDGDHVHGGVPGGDGGYYGRGSNTAFLGVATSTDGVHAHAATGTTDLIGAASVDVTMPYLQLLACRVI